MTDIASPCQFCIHRRDRSCAAYPDGIPTDVLYFDFHSKVNADQQGTDVYSPIPGAPALKDYANYTEADADAFP